MTDKTKRRGLVADLAQDIAALVGVALITWGVALEFGRGWAFIVLGVFVVLGALQYARKAGA